MVGARVTAIVIHNDIISALADVPDNTYDAVLCDPPYGFSFMGKKWDYDVPGVELWREVLRVCKPGGHMVAFGGTRTYHRMTCAIEDAGFEIRDSIAAWVYASGFPKSLDVSKACDKAAGAEREVLGTRTKAGAITGGRLHASSNEIGVVTTIAETAPATPLAEQWAGYGTALKPAWEPAILARKPLESTVAANVAKWGCGGLAIDACRIGTTDEERAVIDRRSGAGYGTQQCAHGGREDGERFTSNPQGRWPANVAMDEEAGAALDAQAGNRPSTPYRENEASGAVLPLTKRTAGGYSDDGGPSRFFYCAKVSTREREYGCENLALRSAAEMTDSEDGQARLESPRSGAGRGGGARNHHPTLKPIALTRWLARLIMPPTAGAQLLVPFSGAGSEMIGALLAGWTNVTGIEQDAEYVEIARARVAFAISNPRAYEIECERAAKADAKQLDMFGRTGT